MNEPIAANSLTSPAPTARTKNSSSISPNPPAAPATLKAIPLHPFMMPCPITAAAQAVMVNLLGILRVKISVIKAASSITLQNHTVHIMRFHLSLLHRDQKGAFCTTSYCRMPFSLAKTHYRYFTVNIRSALRPSSVFTTRRHAPDVVLPETCHSQNIFPSVSATAHPTCFAWLCPLL